MTTRTAALIGLLCFSAMGSIYTAPVEARISADIDIKVAPPAPRYEEVVVRPGYVWAPGYWRWEGGQHVWIRGAYVPERPGYFWEPHHWVQGPHGGWHSYEGRWVSDTAITVAPPAPRYEEVIVRPGYVWSPGYWRSQGGQQAWIAGSYVPERRGYFWDPPHWVQGARGGWHFFEGRWLSDADINRAPPAPRFEQVVVRPGYVWAPGYWRWRGDQHIWVEGAYIRERPGYVWQPHHWVQGPNGGWHFIEGGWVRR